MIPQKNNMVISDICKIFQIKGEYKGYETLKNGNINKTFKVSFSENGINKDYIVQSINTYVFKNPGYIMSNIDKTTAHIAKKLPIEKRERGVLSFLKTAEGNNYYLDGENGFWRSYGFIENSVTYNTFSDLGLLKAAGTAFGDFQLLLSDFDASQLYEIIPGFHDTKKRYCKLFEDINTDAAGRVSDLTPEIEFLHENREVGEALVNMLDSGALPLRVTHNDTKGNNILFDADSGETLAVIDLDTVMPGLVAYDFGDAIRFAANTANEDEPDLSLVGLDLNRFSAFADGFVNKIKATATEKEIETLSLGAIVMTIELAVRFLDDYIEGDKYFKINYPEHNLVRARCQIALAKDMLAKKADMDKVVKGYSM